VQIIKSIINIIRSIFSFVFKTKVRTIISLAVIAVLGFLFYQQFIKEKPTKTALVQRKTLKESITTSGQVKTHQEATLNFPDKGKLAWVNVRQGDKVRKWQGLMGMDARDLDANMTAAYYDYLAADANAKEIEDEVKDHDDDENFEQKNKRVAAQTARDKAYDTWQAAIRDLRDATLVSPFNGIVTEVTTKSPGDTISTADGVTVLNTDTLYFQAEVDEIDFTKAEKGQEAEVLLDAFPGRTFKGVVDQVGKVGVETLGGGINILVDIELESFEENIIYGLKGESEIILGRKDDALVIPREYIIYEKDKSFVNVKVNRKLKKKEVVLGVSNGDYLEVAEGLDEGQEIHIRDE
jgi:RND family efflux transporter MFP subunit